MRDISGIISRAEAIKSRAALFPARRSDAQLYQLLSDCMALAVECRDTGEIEELRAHVVAAAKSRGMKRPHFQSDADAFLIVGRYIFEGEKARAACWRYTSAMREAENRGIAPADLAGWLTKEGGINALFRARRVERRSRRTKTLHLREAVELPKEGNVTLVLRDDGAGFYHVVEVKA